MTDIIDHTPWICVNCGVQFAPSEQPPDECPICEDERQFVGLDGQAWTTLEKLQSTHRNVLRDKEQGRLWGIGTEPAFAIGQRALLVRTDSGNLLWDCVSLLDAATIRQVKALGGVSAIAISHPHYYGSMVEWSRAFDGAPIYLHEAEREWVMRPYDAIVFWEGDSYEIGPGVTLVRTGGHFEGYQCLYWAEGAEQRGALLSGDQPTVCWDRKSLSFMYSYPNFIPLGPEAVRRTVDVLEPLSFDRIYGAWWDRVIEAGGKEALRRSARRYLDAIGAG
jgi:hypothetical protein